MIRFTNIDCGYSLLQPFLEPCLRQEVLSGGDLFFYEHSVLIHSIETKNRQVYIESR